jgi:hypothetical protein
VRLKGLGQLRKIITLFGNRTRDLPACSIVPQLTTLPRAPVVPPALTYKTHNFPLNEFMSFDGRSRVRYPMR